MPGGEDNYDRIRTYTRDSNSKQDSYGINPKYVGKGKPVEQVDALEGDVSEFNNVVWVSPGDDLQSRVDETLRGGMLAFKPGTHDVSEMGTATVDKPMRITMSAGNGDDNSGIAGTYLDNSGSNPVSGPIIDVNGGSDTTRAFGVELASPAIWHEGSGSAIRIDNAPRTAIWKPELYGAGSGATGIQMVGTHAWGTQILTGRIQSFTDYGINDTSAGGLKQLRGTQTLMGSGTGLRAGTQWYVDRSGFGNMDTGVEIHGNNGVFNCRIEAATTGVHVGAGSTKVGQVRIPYLQTGRLSGQAIIFDNAVDVIARHPIKLGSDASKHVQWTADSIRCGLVIDHQAIINLKADPWDIASGAVNPSVDYPGLARITNGTRDSMTADGIPLEGMSIWNGSNSLPQYYDGTEWVDAAGNAV